MKPRSLIAVTCLAMAGLAPTPICAQGFSSGSNGSYGALNITANTTLDLPADGIFHCTTISVAASVTLKFNRNPLNTPVYLLATGDVTIAGTLDVAGGTGNSFAGGVGGPGGFDGGSPGFGSENPAGAGQGPGGGKGGVIASSGDTAVGSGSYRTQSLNAPNRVKNGAIYGNTLLFPIVGGSGGGGTEGNPGYGGSGGGGAILVSSSTKITVTGFVNASGGGNTGSPLYNEGSGGAIRLVAPVVAGNGNIYVNGGNYSSGGFGRTRVDTIDRRSLALSGLNVAGGLMQVFASPLPKLAVVNAAGTAIAEGAAGPVNLTLPFGSSPNQTVTVRARDWNSQVPIRVVLTPDSGDPLIYDTTIDNSSTNPAEVTVNVVMPVNRLVRVNAWTR